MSTTIFRYHSKEAIHAAAAKITNKNANIVFQDGSVIFAKIVKIENDYLIGQNMRLRKVTLPISNITELIIDEKK